MSSPLDSASPPATTKVLVHPLVLLSVVDHYNRVALDTKRRVVGCLLGEVSQGVVDVSNSFAVPFEEDLKDDSVWFLDHDYLDTMYSMFRKINAKEKVVGFYSTGPKLKKNDIEIDQLLRRFNDFPDSSVCLVVDVRPTSSGLPVVAYCSKEAGGTKSNARVFYNVACEVVADEPEEVGVEHLLRDVNDPTVTNLASRVSDKASGLRGLESRLKEIHSYLQRCVDGELEPSDAVLKNTQDIFSLLPNSDERNLIEAFLSKTNDLNLVVYLASTVRSVLALHDLLKNKLDLRALEEENENAP